MSHKWGNKLLNLKMTLKLNNARICGVNNFKQFYSKLKADNFDLNEGNLKHILKSFSFANCSFFFFKKRHFETFVTQLPTWSRIFNYFAFFMLQVAFFYAFCFVLFSFNLSWPAIDQVVAIWISRLTFHDIALWCFVG